MKKKEKELKIIELFSGIGAPKIALNNLKIKNKTLFISEINKSSIIAYNAIFDYEKINNIGDISLFSKKDIEKFKNKCDILFFGSPCQDFSQAGNNLGGKKGSKTRSSLIWYAIEIIKIIKPKIILFENVKNILSKKHNDIIQEYLDLLKKNSYENSKPIILNSKNFGIPQNRERVFILSFLKDKSKRENFDKIIWEKKFKKKVNLKDFLRIEDFKNRKLTSEKIEYRNWNNFSTWKSKSGNINGSYNRAWKIEKYCGTLNVSNVIKITDGENVSKLTPIEYWKLMGINENIFLKVKEKNISDNNLYKLAGNSIVVNVLEEIISEII